MINFSKTQRQVKNINYKTILQRITEPRRGKLYYLSTGDVLYSLRKYSVGRQYFQKIISFSVQFKFKLEQLFSF